MKIWNFPTVPVSKQLFHVPGQAQDGGYTSGAVHMLSPEPGGRGVLEMQIALQVREWDFPFASWIMSMGNGEVFRVRLAPTPQVLSARNAPVPWENGILWANQQPWQGDVVATYAAPALEGSTVVRVNMTGWGDIARLGHVIGHRDQTYLIGDIEYDKATDVATISVKPPLRHDVAVGDNAYFRPYFLATISNIGEVRATYDAELRGAIQPGKIVFAEAIV